MLFRTTAALLLTAAAIVRTPIPAHGAETPKAAAGPGVDRTLLEKLCREEWGGLYASGNKTGYMKSRVAIEKREAGEVVVVSSRMVMKMQYGGLTAEAGATSLQEFAADSGRLLRLRSTMTMNGVVMTTTRISREGDALRQTTTVGGQTSEGTPPACQHDLRSALGPQLLAMNAQAKAGDSITGEMLVPETNSAVRLISELREPRDLLFGGVPVRAWAIQTKVYSLTPAAATAPAPAASSTEPPAAELAPMAVMNIVVDAEGRMIEGQLLGPFSFRMESEESAKKLDQVVDIMRASGLPLDKPIAKPQQASRIVLRLRGMPAASMVNDDRQKYTPQADGSCLLELKPQASPGRTEPLSDEKRTELAEWLKPTEYLQSAAPEIVAQARKTAGMEKDPYRAACLLNAWVDVNVQNEFTPVLSNALDTLKSLRGDCGEHAALFVALCRAAGIPAREVAGLAYEPKLNLLGGHAWAEVHVNGRWVAMDPTFGEALANALHIKVAEGGMSSADGMIRLGDLLGKLKVEVVGTE
jgi:hypothetical protein